MLVSGSGPRAFVTADGATGRDRGRTGPWSEPASHTAHIMESQRRRGIIAADQYRPEVNDAAALRLRQTPKRGWAGCAVRDEDARSALPDGQQGTAPVPRRGRAGRAGTRRDISRTAPARSHAPAGRSRGSGRPPRAPQRPAGRTSARSAPRARARECRSGRPAPGGRGAGSDAEWRPFHRRDHEVGTMHPSVSEQSSEIPASTGRNRFRPRRPPQTGQVVPSCVPSRPLAYPPAPVGNPRSCLSAFRVCFAATASRWRRLLSLNQ